MNDSGVTSYQLGLAGGPIHLDYNATTPVDRAHWSPPPGAGRAHVTQPGHLPHREAAAAPVDRLADGNALNVGQS